MGPFAYPTNPNFASPKVRSGCKKLVCECPIPASAQNIFLASPTFSDSPSCNDTSPEQIIQDVSLRFPDGARVEYKDRFANFIYRATELTVQSERAFQKQPHIFLNSKTKAKSARPGKGGRRWYKDVGLGFRTPINAIEGSYIGMCEQRNPDLRLAEWDMAVE